MIVKSFADSAGTIDLITSDPKPLGGFTFTTFTGTNTSPQYCYAVFTTNSDNYDTVSELTIYHKAKATTTFAGG